MLTRKDLLKELDEKYIGMINKISIPDFTKCIAQFSGIEVQNVPDEIIKEYLVTWARNKYRFFKMMGDKIMIDTPISYKDNTNLDSKYKEICNGYPAYAPWLMAFAEYKENKISYIRGYDDFSSMTRCWLNRNPESFVGTSITHFLKKYLSMPDDVITAVGRIYENTAMEATHTISIDPTDMMLASENPYDWKSCYKLDVSDCSSHADGCLAAVLDTSSLITYVWNNHGKFRLREKYDFKDIRYKRMRQTISISPEFFNIHFNAVYPGKSDYSEELLRQLREPVERIVAKYLDKENSWSNSEWDNNCQREEFYGYGEYSSYNIYTIKDGVNEDWDVFDTPISCPCGCGNILPGSDVDDEDSDYDCGGHYEYNGEGFQYENFAWVEAESEVWCDYCDDYCTNINGAEPNCEDCQGCSWWNDAHPTCELNSNEECPKFDYECWEDRERVDDGEIEPEEKSCKGCPCWERCHQKKEAEAAIKDWNAASIIAKRPTASFQIGTADLMNTNIDSIMQFVRDRIEKNMRNAEIPPTAEAIQTLMKVKEDKAKGVWRFYW